MTMNELTILVADEVASGCIDEFGTKEVGSVYNDDVGSR